MKVLLISNRVFHYRIPVYNYFRSEFLKKGIEFEVVADQIQKSDEEVEFPFRTAQRSYQEYKNVLKEVRPDVVIFFLHLKDSFMFPLYRYCRKNNIRTIYWGHGLNLRTPDHKLKELIFNYVHKRSDAILLYSPREKKYIRQKHHNKILIALNTINFNSFPDISMSKKELRKKYGLEFKTIVLFCGRITRGKRLDMLLDIFDRLEDRSIGLLICGGGITEEMQAIVDRNENIVYMGPVYEKEPVNELHKLSDIYCIPGDCGLGINTAMYWGLPVLTTDAKHGPEIYYLKDGVNGYILKDMEELQDKIEVLAHDKKLLAKLSDSAETLIREEADISNMFRGFEEVVDFVSTGPEAEQISSQH